MYNYYILKGYGYVQASGGGLLLQEIQLFISI